MRPKCFFVRKNLILHRQKNTGGINKINNRQTIFDGHLLRAQVFLCRHRNQAPAFTVASLATMMHCLPLTYPMTTTTPRRTAAIFFIHAVGGHRADLKPCGCLYQQDKQCAHGQSVYPVRAACRRFFCPPFKYFFPSLLFSTAHQTGACRPHFC